jgi:hypothetical protein
MSAWADDDLYTDVGDITAETLLARYLAQPDKNAADVYLANWVDAWTDGFLSVYVYEQLFDRPTYSRLNDCVKQMGPSAISRRLLDAGHNPETKDTTVSLLLYYAVRHRCKDVLGAVQPEATNGGSTS